MKASNHFLLKNKSILFFKIFELKKEPLKYSCLLVFASLLFSFSAISQTNISGVINDYQSVSAITFPGCGPCDNSPACLNAITVGNVSAFSIGDKVLIIQMKGATIDNTNTAAGGSITDIGNAGNYEFFTISNIIGNVIYPNGALVNAYDVPGLVQLVRVPNFSNNVNVNGLVSGIPWDPVLGVGGVVAIFVEDTLTLNANIDAGEMGYNGVTVTANGTLDICTGVDPDTYMVLPSTDTESSPKGQGIVVDDPNFNRGRAPRANGGGGGMAGDSGGGGGSNFGVGGIGGKRWCNTDPTGLDAGGLGGKSLASYLAQRRVYLGGAGGAGYITNLNPAIATNGGGIVVIRARHIVGNNHTIFAQGADSTAPGTGIDGGGGGGAGGSVAFDIESYSGTVNVDVSGGDGQDLGTDVLHGPGGGGGGGVFLHNLSTPPANIIIDRQGGIAGVHQAPQDTNTNGAQDGAIGGIISYYSIVETPDRDNDGVPNFCDLDSDGDGILDADEAGGSAFDPSKDADGDGIENYLDDNDVTLGFPVFTDANGDGVNDLYDNDGDGFPDFLDLDSDNDGIFDVIEAGGVDGDGDGLIGTGALVDTDNDGWSNIADPDNGGTLLPLTQSDADSIPDFLDVDSDGDGCYDAIEGSGSFVAGDLTSSNNLADDDEGSVDSVGVPTNTGSPQGTNAFVTTASALGGITTQPTASSICLGSDASYAVVDTGDDLVYQWQEKIGAGAWTNLSDTGIYSNTGTATLTLTAPPIGHSGREYRVVITSTTNLCKNVISDEVGLTINALDNAGFNYSAAAYCVDASDPTPTITGLAGGTFSSTVGLSITAGTGAIDVSASTPGTYTVTYTTNGTCPNSSTSSVTINALDNAGFNYSAAAYCVDASDPTPTITGLAGGTFSSTVGLSITAGTGAIDVSASTPGTYTVTYTTNGTCPNSSTSSVTINALDNAGFNYSAAAYCVDASDPTPTITGLAGGTFSSTVGLSITAGTGAIDVSASTPGTYTVTYTTNGTCPNSSTSSVTINALDNAGFNYSAAAYCIDASDPTPTITGLAGGTFSSTVGLSITAGTGAIDVSASTPGTYTVTYTTNGTCPNSSTSSVTINALDNAGFNYSAAAYCVDASDPTPTITGLAGGIFSSTVGLSITAGTGAIDVSASTPGTYTVTYTTNGTCPNSSTSSVTINALDNAGFNYSAAAYCIDASDPTPTITGLAGGTFSSTVGLSITAGTGAIDVSASTPGTYTVTYTTNGTCPNSSTSSVTINALDNAGFNYSAAAYCVDASDPTPTITGLAGGIFSSTVGLSITAGTGAIDVSASTPGTYTVTYTTNGTCPNSSTSSVTINALDNAGFNYSAAAYCVDASDPTPTITGLAGGTFSSTVGLSITAGTGAIDVSASTPGTYTVTYTTNGTCPNSSTSSVTINALDNAGFNYSAAAYCVDASDPTPTITGLAGGTFSSTVGLSITAGTGAIDVSASTPGTYTVTYTTNGTCPNSSTSSVTINALDNAGFNYSAAAYCVDASDPTPTITGLAGGIFSSTVGLSITAGTGAIDVSASTPGTYTVTYTTNGTCPNSSTSSVTINALDNAGFNYSAAAYCIDASDPTPTITGLAGGIFSSTVGLSITAGTGAIDVSASTPGTYTVTYTTNGTCPNSSTSSVTINALPNTPVMTTNSPVCSGGDAVFTITGTPNDIVTYNGSASGNVTIGALGTVSIIINNIIADVLINLVNISNVNCSSILSISESIVINLTDSDGDGVIDCDETIDGTDLNDSCSFILASVSAAPSATWNAGDCDDDGVTNGTEVSDGTDPLDDCSFLTASITLTVSSTSDCDGDGVPNNVEDTDNTDPQDPCSFVLASASVAPSATWNAADCDGDGVTNGTEVTDGTDPLNNCSFLTASITLPVSSTNDCDGDGVPNNVEGTDGTDPQDPCSFVLASASVAPSAAWNAADCDGDGVTNGTEVTDGTDPLDDCSFLTASITLAVSSTSDCDGDGVPNNVEDTDSTDPQNPCSFVLTSASVAPSAAWNGGDCDGDGVTNGTEVTDGTDPLDDCSFLTASITLAVTSTSDCDGDGVPNNVEDIDGTDPQDPCSFVLSNASVAPSATWNAADCDGDGVTNGTEVVDNTDPLDDCSFILSSASVAPSAAWNAGDCDGDGVTNGDELTPPDGETPTDPQYPCSFRATDITLTVTTTVSCIGGLEVIKMANVSGTELGDTITYTIEVENTGNVTLTNVVLVDTFTDINGNPLVLTQEPVFDGADLGSSEGTLLAGEIATYTATFEITQQAINSGGVSNSIIASGDTPSFEIIMDMSDDGDDVDGNTTDDPTETELGCLIVINEFSPNGDGINEFLIINCIESYPNNRLEIYNRWGNIVYKKQSYNNEFNGISNGRSTINGTEKLPVGTYYYVLDLADGSKPKVGWLYINR